MFRFTCGKRVGTGWDVWGAIKDAIGAEARNLPDLEGITWEYPLDAGRVSRRGAIRDAEGTVYGWVEELRD